MTFARFMELALYDPDGGYYRGAEARPAASGDFLTAPEAHPIFGPALAAVRREAGSGSAGPPPFVVREHGAGTGRSRWPILRRLGRERAGPRAPCSATARSRSSRGGSGVRRRLARGRAFADPRSRPGRRRHARSSASSSPTRSSTRCPSTASSARRTAAARSVVGWRRRPPSSRSRPTRRRRRSRRVSPPRASRSPTASAPRSASRSTPGSARAAAGLDRGILLLIDYGYPAAELYDPVRRRDGHAPRLRPAPVHDDPYGHVGRQDLTAHVDVDRGRARPRAPPASPISGPRPRRSSSSGSAPEELLQERPGRPGDDARGLPRGRARRRCGCIDPAAMGRFRVMAFGRAWPAGPPPAGFAYRDAALRPDRAIPPHGTGSAPTALRHTALLLRHDRPKATLRLGRGTTRPGSGARTGTRARRAPLPDPSRHAPDDASPAHAAALGSARHDMPASRPARVPAARMLCRALSIGGACPPPAFRARLSPHVARREFS